MIRQVVKSGAIAMAALPPLLSLHDHDHLENSWSIHPFGIYSHSSWTVPEWLTHRSVSCLWRMRIPGDATGHLLQRATGLSSPQGHSW